MGHGGENFLWGVLRGWWSCGGGWVDGALWRVWPSIGDELATMVLCPQGFTHRVTKLTLTFDLVAENNRASPLIIKSLIVMGKNCSLYCAHQGKAWSKYTGTYSLTQPNTNGCISISPITNKDVTNLHETFSSPYQKCAKSIQFFLHLAVYSEFVYSKFTINWDSFDRAYLELTDSSEAMARALSFLLSGWVTWSMQLTQTSISIPRTTSLWNYS